jgi:hypothetical protein
LDALPSRERNLILCYLGLEGKTMTFQELAIRFNYNGPSSTEKVYRRVQGSREAESCSLERGVWAVPKG